MRVEEISIFPNRQRCPSALHWLSEQLTGALASETGRHDGMGS